MSNQYYIIALKAAITFGLLFWVGMHIDIEVIQTTLLKTDTTYLILAIISHIAAFILLSIRWWYLFKIKERSCNYRDIIDSYYLGLFCNNFLPTGVGGDVIRVLRLRKAGFNTHFLVSSSLLDRIMGLTSILLMGLVALIFLPQLELSTNIKIMLTTFIFCIPLGFSILFSDYVARLLTNLSAKFTHNKLLRFILSVATVLHEYSAHRQQLLGVLILSFAAQYSVILCYVFLGMSLNIEIHPLLYVSIIPIVFLATALPISIGGFGVREGVFISLLQLFSVNIQTAISFSLLYVFVITALTLPGGILILTKTKNAIRK